MDGRLAQSSPQRQRRGSLPASPALPPTAWAFRDEMGLPTTGIPREPLLHERSQSTSGVPLRSSEEPAFKRNRRKWTAEETQMLVDGCNAHGVGNWKAILNDPTLTFEPGRSPVDLKDRFRTYFPDAYKHHYPNAKTHLSDKIRSSLPNGASLFEKTRTKRRRPFSPEEDDALRRGYEKHGTLWAQIAQDPVFQAHQRRSTDLRDRFRNAFPDLYEAAGYKPRTSNKKASSVATSSRSTDSPGKQPTRSRVRRRLTYPGMLQSDNNAPSVDSGEYSSGDEDDVHHPLASSATTPQTPSARPPLSGPSNVNRRPGEAYSHAPRRSSSPLPDQDTLSLSSQSHFLSGPASPSSPRHCLVFPDSRALDDDDLHKSSSNTLDWLVSDPQSDPSHAPLTASSLFSANIFGSYSAPRHDVLDRYDLYSSPLSSTANTFGDYVSEMGIGGSFSEADLDLNAFAGPASSMGFTHHSHVAGDLIFASHHGGHLQHGHGFSLQDSNRAIYSNEPPSNPQGLGLSNIPFNPNPEGPDPHHRYDPSLDAMMTADQVSLALLGQAGHDAGRIPDVFTVAVAAPNLTVSPADLTRPPSPPGARDALLPATSQPASRVALSAPSSHFVPVAGRTPDQGVAGPLPLSPIPIRRPSPHAHLRSASQPPGQHRLPELRRNVLLAGASVHPPPAVRDDCMQDLLHRPSDPYALPFLDLHYYGVSDVHASSSTAERGP